MLNRQERLDIIACVVRVPGVTRVIDSLTLIDETPSTYVYAMRGSEHLRRLAEH